MRPIRTLPLYVLAALLVFAVAAKPQAVTPAVRIVNAIDENDLVALKGNTHPLANAKNDRGPVNTSLPMTDLILLLSRSPEQQAAFDKFVADQYDPHSPDFHHWLEPAQVGEDFGPSQTDIQTISNWLTGHGFSVDEVSNDRMTIRFSGTAGQVQSAFHTQIHNFEVGGVSHIGNMGDPQIPSALSSAVAGVKALHNFFPKPMHKLGGKVQFNRGAGKWQRIADAAAGDNSISVKTAAPSLAHPEFGINATTELLEDVAPYDFAKIYNVLPLWNAGIDGTGQTIAIAGTSNITVSDVASFRSLFGLPANTPQVVIANGTDPGVCPTTDPNYPNCLSDLTENTLDVEWSGAVAKGASIVLVTAGANSTTTDTLYASENYIVQNKTASIMNVSYGQCELFNGTAENALYNTMWQTAASEGISVFVASGDAGAALCDDGSDQEFGTPWAAQFGLAVNGLASSQFDTAVGGTDFNWGTTASPYWNSTNNSTTGASALGYVPEVPWNDTCTNPLTLSVLKADAKDVNYSGTAVTDAETACNFIATDSIYIFQNFEYSNTTTPVDLSFFVDTVGGSGGASKCSTNTTTNTTVGTCTSGHSKPSWQTALTPADGARDLPDVSFFAANGFLGSAYLICVSANGACVTSTSLTAEPTAQEIGGTSVSSPAMAGVMALINQSTNATQGSPNAELYTLAGGQNYGNCSAESVTSGSATCLFNDIDTGTISMPCDYGAPDGGIVDSSELIAQQPGVMSPNCTPTHPGDTVGILAGVNAGKGYDLASGLGSLNVTNVVSAWPGAAPIPAFSISGTNVAFTAGATTGNTSTISVAPSNGFTGTVTFSCAVTTKPTGATSPVTCPAAPASVSITGTTAQTTTLTINSTATTTAGAYAVTVTGTSGSLSETEIVNVTVTIPTYALSNGGNIAVAQGVSGTTSISVAPSNGFTGTVAFSCAVTTKPTGATSPVTCPTPASVSITGTTAQTTTLTINSTATTTAGAYAVTVTGTSGSLSKTDIVNVTVTAATVTTPTYALGNGGSIAVAQGASASNTTPISITPSGGFTGSVALTCAFTTNAATDPATCSLSPASVTVSGTAALSSTLTVTTTAPTTTASRNESQKLFWPFAEGTTLALLLFAGVPRVRRNWLAILGLLVLFVSAGAIGCGGGGGGGGGGTTPPPVGGTTPGTYTITVTGTSGTTTESTTVTLTVSAAT